MSINPQSYLAFAAELSKIAFLNTLGRAAQEGWKSGGPMGKVLNVGVPLMQLPGALKQEDPTGQGRSRTERVADVAGQGVGGMVGMGAAGLATKRLGWHAPTSGGMFSNMGKALKGGVRTTASQAGKFMGRNVLLGGVLPMVGGYAASKLLTTPSRMARKRREEQAQQQMGSAQQPSPNPGEGAAQTPIAQEGQQGQMR